MKLIILIQRCNTDELKKLIVLFLVSCTASNLLCQEQVHESFESVDIWKGLTTKEVLDMEEDSLGFLWMATHSGVARFDGIECTYFKTCASGQFETLDINVPCLFKDKGERLWVGSTSHGLFYKELWGTCFRHIDFDGADTILNNSTILSIAEDSKGVIWFCTKQDDGVLFAYDRKAHKLKKVPLPTEAGQLSSLTDIIYDKYRHKIVVFLNYGLVAHLDEETLECQFSKFPFVYGNKFNYEVVRFEKLSIAPDGTLWANSYPHGVTYFVPEKNQWVEFRPDLFHGKPIQGVKWFADDLGFVLVEDDGMYQFEKGKQSYKYYQGREPQSLQESVFNDMLLSKNGDLWICGFHAGAQVHFNKSIYTNSILNTSNTPSQVLNFPVLCIYPLGGGEYYIGTDGLGLFKYSIKTNAFVPVKIADDNPNVIKTIYKDTKGKFWFGHWAQGLSTYDPKLDKWERILNIGGKNLINVWSILEDKEGALWISLLQDGILRIGKDEEVKNVAPHLSKNLSYKLLAMICDRQNNIWLAFESKGVGLIRAGTEEVEELSPANSGLSSYTVLSVYEDKKGNIWVGTTMSGLNLLVDGRFKVFNTSNGLLSNNVQSVFEDFEGNINVVSGIGITSFKLNENNEMTSISYVRSKNSNFLFHRSFASTPDGTILVGGSRGLLQVRHKIGAKNEPPPSVVVSKVRTGYSLDIPEDRNILMNILRDGVAVLPKGATNLYIYLTNTRLAYSDITEYEFWMEGLNKEWSKLKRGENRIAFENLDGGNYKLHLRCRNNYSWGPETVIKVKVSLPIWETGWFRLGLIFTVFAAAIIALVLRNKALRININKQELEIEKAHLLLEKENLKEEVATKDVQLLASSVQYAQKNELFNEIRTMLHTLRTENSNNTAPTLRRLINVIEGEIKGEDEWESFKYYFDKINLDFSEKLLKIEPTLTPNDIRMAMLVRLNISTKEIAKLLNITPMGVQKSKYRLKKRLGLEEKDDLKEYLLSFDSQE